MARLREGTIPMNPAEAEALQAIAGPHGIVSVTRRDPGESGPVLAHAEDSTYEISETGKVTRIG